MEIIKKNKIAIIDEDLNVLKQLSDYFKIHQYEVITYQDPLKAVSDCNLKSCDWDVVLTDFHFVNISASNFSVLLKKSKPDIPILLISPLEETQAAFSFIELNEEQSKLLNLEQGGLQLSVERALRMKKQNTAFTDLNKILQEQDTKYRNLIGLSPQFLAAVKLAERVAPSYANILIYGESGTGKEVFANYIHGKSKCKNGPFIAFNCASIPENLLETELFGHCKGSFTGASEKRIGLFEAAQDGTLFLDEIGDLSPSMQAKILRVLQEKKIKKIGENKETPINCRIISATHKNLALEVLKQNFREDLYFRLNVIPIQIPALRDRNEDVLLLAESFLKKFAKSNQSSADHFSAESLQYITDKSWRGNVRELENNIERAVILCKGNEIQIENFLPSSSLDLSEESSLSTTDSNDDESTFKIELGNKLLCLEDVISLYINFAIHFNGGARDKTAKALGIDRKTLYKRCLVAESKLKKDLIFSDSKKI